MKSPSDPLSVFRGLHCGPHETLPRNHRHCSDNLAKRDVAYNDGESRSGKTRDNDHSAACLAVCMTSEVLVSLTRHVLLKHAQIVFAAPFSCMTRMSSVLAFTFACHQPIQG